MHACLLITAPLGVQLEAWEDWEDNQLNCTDTENACCHAAFAFKVPKLVEAASPYTIAPWCCCPSLSTYPVMPDVTEDSEYTCRSTGEVTSNARLLGVMDKLDAVLHAFVGCQDVNGAHNACRLVWNAALPLLDQKLSKQVKRTMTSAAQALASVASPLHSLR